MYRLRHFKEIYGKWCVGKLDSFTTYSIYDFHLLTFENLANNVFRLFTPCENIYLLWLYWYVLLLSIAKILLSFHEIYVIFGQRAKLYLFRDRKLHSVSNLWRSKVRQFVACIISIMDLYLFLGILTMKPHFMTPWIYVQFFTLLLDILLWISDVCFGMEIPSCYDLVLFLIIYFNLESIWCIRKIFLHAISQGRTDGYSLL